MKLSANPLLPLDNKELVKRLTDLFREHAQQVNGITEGSISVDHSARTSVPTTGTWKAGDLVRNSEPADVDGVVVFGWLCIESGTPGTWIALEFSTSGAGGSSALETELGDWLLTDLHDRILVR